MANAFRGSHLPGLMGRDLGPCHAGLPGRPGTEGARRVALPHPLGPVCSGKIRALAGRGETGP